MLVSNEVMAGEARRDHSHILPKHTKRTDTGAKLPVAIESAIATDCHENVESLPPQFVVDWLARVLDWVLRVQPALFSDTARVIRAGAWASLCPRCDCLQR